jgi:hypothetical protein
MIPKETIEDRESIWKKIILVSTSIILILLVVSYILASYPLFTIISSLSESKSAKNEIIVMNDFSVLFTENTYEELQEYYNKDLSVEMAVCLKGIKVENYTIDEIYQPRIIDQTFSHVLFEPCSKDTLILLHSHPFRKCIASEQDLLTLNAIKQDNNDSLMIIMCEPDRFSVYG